MPPLTEEQRAAIECRQHSVALSAGAGCGKTFVLTERFLSHFDSATYAESRATHLSQLIAITFTDAAAREMRSRIRNACYARLQEAASPEQQQLWLRYLREIDGARISTIHAFCTTLLRTHAAHAGLEPTFGVLDQADADVLQFEVIDDVLRHELADLDDATLDLAATYSLRQLKEQIAELLSHRHSNAFKDFQDKTPEDLVARWRAWHATHAIPNAIAEISAAAPIAAIIRLLESLGVPRNEKFRDCRATLLNLLPRLKDLNSTLTASDLKALRAATMLQGVCTAKDWPDGQYEAYRDACKALRDQIDKHQPRPFVDSVAMETARLGVELLKLTAKISQEYEERKRTLGKLDFDDLLARAHLLISNQPELAQRLSDDLRLLLVDEFQDTDHLQTELVTKLCGPGFDAGRLFFVGDFKQSIYRFRGAAPDVFRNLRQSIQAKGRLSLTNNFRSQPEILHFVNALFCNTFTSTTDGADTYEQLIPSRPQATAKPAIEFLWTITPNKNNRRMPGSAQRARISEAQTIAERLKTLLDESCTDLPIVDKTTKQLRRLEPGDVAILFRSLSDVQFYENALHDAGLDYYLVGGYAFYAQQEIFDVLNLLRAIASTADEVSLAGVLRSPFFSLEDETLFWLNDKFHSLNAGLQAARPPDQLSETEAAKVASAAATLAHLRSTKDSVPIAELLNTALDRTGYDAVVLTEFLGHRKLANLQKLIERARLTDLSGANDLDGFITQLSQFISREPREALAATLPEAANVIRLMTIHHAKGLEFPLVVVPDLDRPPLLQTPSAAIHPELGPLVRQPADDDNEKITTGMTLYGALERRAELEERKRLFYVACTRAADHLILSSSLEATDKLKSDWMELLAERFNLENGGLNVSLPKGYDVPAIGVTIVQPTDDKPSRHSHGPDLLKLLDDAPDIAATGHAIVPPGVAPVPVDRAAQHQFSFSRLTGQLISTHRQPRDSEPRSINEEASEVEARGLGRLVHDVLERIDLAQAADVHEWCEHLAANHVVQNTERAAQQAAAMIERFLDSPRGRQLATAPAVHREVDFLLAWPPGETNTTGRYIQGVIDCLYQDTAGNWHIADFKTNDVTPKEIAREAERYQLQLYVYAMAIEQALGRSPSELVLNFLRPGAEFVIFWNDTARSDAIRQVTKLIDETIRPPN